MEEVARGCRRLHNEERLNLYASPIAGIEDMRNAYRILVDKPEGRGRGTRRWEDNIRQDLWKIGWEGAD
jgi:hypothetical protein